MGVEVIVAGMVGGMTLLRAPINGDLCAEIDYGEVIGNDDVPGADISSGQDANSEGSSKLASMVIMKRIISIHTVIIQLVNSIYSHSTGQSKKKRKEKTLSLIHSY